MPTSPTLAAVELPYGRKRALEIATTLALDPEMMLLDEPTAGMGHEDVDRIARADQARLGEPHRPDGRAQPVGRRHRCRTASRCWRAAQVLAEGDYATVSKDPRVIEAYIGSGHG